MPAPLRIRTHGNQQLSPSPGFGLFLDGPPVEHGTAQNPAIVSGYQVLFDEHLVEAVIEVPLCNERLRVDTSQQVCNQVTLAA